jgi:glycosyltransferase involved in cell wall biosynthesis
MSSSPQLACAVLSFAGEPSLVAAVRSIMEQSEPVEIVVVNSGGGDPEATLGAAGLNVPAIDHPTRLFPGAVRNLGIEATDAPFVSFLAADCEAEPGWAAGRLRAHRAGAAAVASVLTSARPASRSASASLLLLHHRRLPDTPPEGRQCFGLSYERGLFRRYGRFREDLRCEEDTDFNSRLGREVQIAWAPYVRTRHLYPDSPAELVSDLYRRGRLRANAVRRDGLPHGNGIVLKRLGEVVPSLRTARRTADPATRRQLLRAWPLLLPGALAFAIGGLTASIAPARALDQPG